MSKSLRNSITISAVLISGVLASSGAVAEVIGRGDVSPVGPTALPINGGPASGDVIVGDTDVGELIIDIPIATLPLESDNGTIGNTELGQGIVTITGAASGDPSQWTLEDTLVVGGFGYGEVSVRDGARLISGANSMTTTTAPDMILGLEDSPFSQGFLFADGFGTRVEHNELSVGEEGYGRVELTNRAWMRTLEDATLGRELVGSTARGGHGVVTVDGQGTRWSIADDLIVGDEGRGDLEIYNQGWVIVSGTMNVSFSEPQSYGEVLVRDQWSRLWVEEDLVIGNASGPPSAAIVDVASQGLLRVDEDFTVEANGVINLSDRGTLLTDSITNSGIIRGDGRIEAALVNNTGSYLRNAAGIANLREKLLVTGTVDNSGVIESVGGEMEFDSAVTNNTDAVIVADKAILRFDGGITNNGDALISDSLIYLPQGQTFNNVAALTVQDGPSEIDGSLTLDTAGTLTLFLDDDQARLEVSDNISLAGTLRLELEDGYLPTVGETIEILSGQSITGMFDTEAANANFDYTVQYASTAVFLNITSVAVNTSGPGDFDEDGDVDGDDLPFWETGYGTDPGATPGDGDADADGDVDGLDFLTWQRVASGGTAATVSANAVPEPSSLLLGLSLLTGLGLRRQR